MKEIVARGCISHHGAGIRLKPTGPRALGWIFFAFLDALLYLFGYVVWNVGGITILVLERAQIGAQ